MLYNLFNANHQYIDFNFTLCIAEDAEMCDDKKVRMERKRNEEE